MQSTYAASGNRSFGSRHLKNRCLTLPTKKLLSFFLFEPRFFRGGFTRNDTFVERAPSQTLD